MKYLTFDGFIVVPDDFNFEADEKIANWVDKYLFEGAGLCEFDSDTGCNPEHHVAVRVLSEEQFNARYDEDE